MIKGTADKCKNTKITLQDMKETANAPSCYVLVIKKKRLIENINAPFITLQLATLINQSLPSTAPITERGHYSLNCSLQALLVFPCL